jgi:hypothetical protein
MLLGMVVQPNRSAWHPIVKRAASALRNEFPSLADSWRIAGGPGHFSLLTTRDSVERALSILDLLVRLCTESAFEVRSETNDDQPAGVLVEGHFYTFRIVERSTQLARDLTPKERDALFRDARAYAPSRVRKQGTGQLRLEVLSTTGRRILSRNETQHQRLDDVLYKLPAELLRHAVEQAVREALAKERAERADADRRRRQALIDVKQDQLHRLAEVEGAANRWERARRLSRYARAMCAHACSEGTTGNERQRLLAEAQWTQRAADWLDPFVKQHWPEVDDVPS